NLPPAACGQPFADYKSAIRQIKNPRYGKQISAGGLTEFDDSGSGQIRRIRVPVVPPHPDPLPVGEGTALEHIANNQARLLLHHEDNVSPSPHSPITLTPDPSPIGWERGTGGRGPGLCRAGAASSAQAGWGESGAGWTDATLRSGVRSRCWPEVRDGFEQFIISILRL